MRDINLGRNIGGYSKTDTSTNSFYFFQVFQERIWQLVSFQEVQNRSIFLRFKSSKKGESLTSLRWILKRGLGYK